MVKVFVALLQPFFTVPKSSGSGAMVRHTGPIAAVNGTVVFGFDGDDTLKVRYALSVLTPAPTAPCGHTRTTAWNDSLGCSSFEAIGPPTIENAGSPPAAISMPER